MDDASKSPAHKVVCPLCEGKGQLPENVLIERLNEKDFFNKVKSYVTNFVGAELKSGDVSRQRESDHWNLTHFLWRRSPKE